MKRLILLIFILLLPILFSGKALCAEKEVLSIKAIEIKGNSKVEESTIRFHIKTKPGDDFSVNQLREDLKEIYNLGFFKDVKIDVQDFEGGLKVIFVVFEKPTINRIVITGNNKIKDDDIREQLAIKENIIFNINLMKESVEKIKLLYQTKGYLFAEVNSYEHEISGNRVDVEINIDEGEKMKIDKITFTGNKSFTSEELKKVMQTKEKNFFSFITKKGTYIKELLKDDALLLSEFYYNHGYIQAHVSEPGVEVNKAKKEIYVTIPIIEGEQFRVGKIDFKGDPVIPPEEMRKRIALAEGSVFSRQQLKGDIDRLSDLYSQKGYALVDIAPLTHTEIDKRLVNITYDIDKGKRMFVGNINIHGNTTTKDKVIRREFKLSEGEVFDSEKLRKSKRSLDFTGYFSDVEIDTNKSVRDDIIDIDANIKETETGIITFGGGYSSVEKVMFGASISQNNFLGGGQRLSFATYLTGLSTQFRLTHDNPAFLDTAVGLRTTLFNTAQDYLYFDRDSRGGSLGFYKELRENITGALHYRLERTEVSNIDEGITSRFIQEQVGTTTTSSINPSIRRDTRNRRFNTSSGSVTALGLEFAGGPLGGNNDFYRGNATVQKYVTVWKKKGLIFAQKADLGMADAFGGKDLPIFERYFAGGVGSLRGYEYHDIGPKEDGESVGGNARLIFNSELRYPLLDQMNVTAVGFFDAGNVYDQIYNIDPFDLRAAVGPGIRFFTPIGPMGFEYGFKIAPKPGESAGEFHFRVGTGF